MVSVDDCLVTLTLVFGTVTKQMTSHVDVLSNICALWTKFSIKLLFELCVFLGNYYHSPNIRRYMR